jgi:hypothetical protein
MNDPNHNPYFNFAWKAADRLNRLNKKVPLPRQRCTWCFIGIAVALLTTTLLVVLLLHGNSSAGQVFCYTKVQSNGITAYAKSDTPSNPSVCTRAAVNSGTAKLSSLPPGVTQVCDNGLVTVYMSQDQIAVLRNLGLNPASVCS